jgi:hypothetical protein
MGSTVIKDWEGLAFQLFTVDGHGFHPFADSLGVFHLNLVNRIPEFPPHAILRPLSWDRWVNQEPIFLWADAQDPVRGYPVQPL